MLGKILKYQPTPRAAMIVSIVGVAIAVSAPALAGPATRVAKKIESLITGKLVKDRSLSGRDIKRGSLRIGHIKKSDLKKLRSQGGPAVPGPQGEQGHKGEAGPQGERGLQGVPGPQGGPGPQGERGQMGLQGNSGPAGISGYEEIKATSNLRASEPSKWAEVRCSDGKNALGGSAIISNLDGFNLPPREVALTSSQSYRTATLGALPNAWGASAREVVDTGQNWELKVTAICARVAF